ncbi:MAG: hypothetical protein GY845_03160 [Planctomycetes bacterium]|nr:hypothetical protein [Planctomycetota bacterium]
MKNYNLTQEEFKYLFRYIPQAGKFFKIQRNNKEDIPAKIKHDSYTGYPYIDIKRQFYYLHDLAYLYMTGEFPEGKVVHKNGKKYDVKWDNISEEFLPINLAKLSHTELKEVLKLASAIQTQKERNKLTKIKKEN